ncbi:1,2-dihydroxy-3-keto-5-methylthiopentene dioxygenase [Lactarius hengduanensis]|nr:1,2-dihydroxy-3-keto-5-methylthiopentene dioxygenase [Lactarius hengduanensis]
MHAYYYDNVSADQRLPHDSGLPVELDYLRKLGLTLSTVPLDTEGGWEPLVDKIANEHGWDNRDTMDVTKEGLGDHFEQMLDKFFTEHMHNDAEIRYILSGSGYWDIREYPTDQWIRVRVLPGDFIIIPAGIYHRFTLDEHNQVKALRFTTGELQYSSTARGSETDASPFRDQYLDSIKEVTVGA